ncbi:beta-lactamase class A [Chitinophaga jiangningensis]|uniref:beta-lactamase n=1 Tax=Chitinophaga jiangningensis TaxID=1419482 RepID=A0A1M7L0S6_9BACT|nr:serine hydrolase [Chitinophaga jiangningensis]SHM71106.1 beta-lactamase class A [Chitinophaga jiangningensis]
MKTLFAFLAATLLAIPAFAQRTDKKLQETLTHLLKDFHGQVGIYVHHLKNDKVVEINADTIFPTASMIKTTIQVGIFDKIAKGELQYRQPLIYRDSLLYAGVDILGSFKDSQQIDLDKVVMLMLTMSDNTASLWLQSLAGGGATINSWLEQHGFKVLRVNSRTPGREEIRKVYGWGQTSPREMAQLMEMVYKGEVIDKASSERMYRNLTCNHWDAQGLLQVPANIRTASKNGAVDDARSEVIMVNGPHGDYVYCITTKNIADQSWKPENEAWRLMRKVGSAIWQHYEPNGNKSPDPAVGKF